MGKVIQLRAKSGSVAAVAHRNYGKQKKRFHIFDRQSALAALRLRGKTGSARERQGVISQAMRFIPLAAKNAVKEDHKNMPRRMKK